MPFSIVATLFHFYVTVFDSSSSLNCFYYFSLSLSLYLTISLDALPFFCFRVSRDSIGVVVSFVFIGKI